MGRTDQFIYDNRIFQQIFQVILWNCKVRKRKMMCNFYVFLLAQHINFHKVLRIYILMYNTTFNKPRMIFSNVCENKCSHLWIVASANTISGYCLFGWTDSISTARLNITLTLSPKLVILWNQAGIDPPTHPLYYFIFTYIFIKCRYQHGPFLAIYLPSDTWNQSCTTQGVQPDALLFFSNNCWQIAVNDQGWCALSHMDI